MSDNPLLTYGPLVGQLHGLTESMRTMPPPVRPLADIDNPLAGPSLAEGWSANARLASDYIEQQRQAAIDRGELDPETGWPTPLGNRRSAMALGTGLVLGSTAPEFRVNPLRVFHGTPHAFEPTPANPLGEFDLGKIGTGEGAQVYGHGAYLAENEAIAKHYRDTLAEGGYEATVNGQPVLSLLNRLDQEGSSEPGESLALEYLNRATSWLAAHNQVRYATDAEGVAARKWLEAHKDAIDFSSPSGGHIYEAELHVDPEHMLHWDLPLSQQSPYVQERVMSKFGTPKPDGVERLPSGRYAITANGQPVSRSDGWPDLSTAQYVLKVMRDTHRDVSQMTGEQLYKHASSAGDYYDPAAGAAALRDAGIPALRYRDANSRNVQLLSPAETVHGQWLVKQVPNGDVLYRGNDEAAARAAHASASKHNYVVFDPKTINIVRRYGIGALMGGGAAAGAAQQGGE